MRPTAEQLRAAADLTIPDVLPEAGARFAVLFCGINPGLYSGATGHHFARPGNRFWPALHLSGFTDRQLQPHEQDLLAAAGLGITNLAARTTARADELSQEELKAGGEKLTALVAERRPAFLAVAGVTAYRTAFGRRKAAIGLQEETLGTTRIWVLPNPSGLNAGWSLDRMAEEFARLRDAAEQALR